jgi:cell division protein FtsN
MAHDFAHRTARPQRSTAQSAAGTRFHLTSFASGALFGAVLAIAAFLAPRWWPMDSLEAKADPAPAKEETANVDTGPKYVFYTELERSRVKTDPTPYDGPAAADREKPQAPSPSSRPPAAKPASATSTAPATQTSREFILQAGSFRARDDADRLRQTLEAVGFNSITTAVRMGDGSQVHRVLVGPFTTEVDVHRAMIQLKERNIDPLLLKR